MAKWAAPWITDAAHEESASQASGTQHSALSTPNPAEQVVEALKEVYDPELAVNIVDLGLVYGVDVEAGSVTVTMTLTSPGCPIAPMIQTLVHGAVKRILPEAEKVDVNLVWSPPWDPYEMASEEGKDVMGIW